MKMKMDIKQRSFQYTLNLPTTIRKNMCLNMGNKFERKIAVITGATSDIGLATTFFISFIFHKCEF